MARDGYRTIGSGGEAGQAALMMLAVVAAVLAGALLLLAFGNALGPKGRHQRAADLAAISAAQAMRGLYPRLFERRSSSQMLRTLGIWRTPSTASRPWPPRSEGPSGTASTCGPATSALAERASPPRV
jgi:hypothetical protein